MSTFANRDLELEQCYARMAVTALLVIWTIYWALNQHSPISTLALEIVGFYTIFVVVHWIHVRHYRGDYPLRRMITLLADHGTCTGAMFMVGEMATFAIFVSPWVTLGTGFRFGLKWMIISGSIAIISIIILGMVPGYWNQHFVWIVSLLALNTVIPAYVRVLIRGLEDARTKLAQYANVMEKMALKDSLTGLPNRLALYEELNRACAHAMRHESSIALLYFDLDGFKKVNDTFGHTVGDLLLKETALRVGGVLRSEDVLARLGGDEFVAVLQMQKFKKHTNLFANRILEAILSIETINGHAVTVSASVGGIFVNGQAASRIGAEQLVHEADKNMYLAKKGGKNRIVLTDFVDESATHIPEVAQFA